MRAGRGFEVGGVVITKNRAALPRIRFHNLRHTAASLALGRGVNPKMVSEM